LQARVIDAKVIAKARKKDFEISRISRFRHRTRYFTDSGIIRSKDFGEIRDVPRIYGLQIRIYLMPG
jgi:hypothetical protein